MVVQTLYEALAVYQYNLALRLYTEECRTLKHILKWDKLKDYSIHEDENASTENYTSTSVHTSSWQWQKNSIYKFTKEGKDGQLLLTRLRVLCECDIKEETFTHVCIKGKDKTHRIPLCDGNPRMTTFL